ncbi:hypothetical protein HJC23_004351 [Cyclotella cryptica]|uniref:3-dehydrosphinganine reductase n=1 Tax=Cyclotella cryptica TaxID=29204 RepID=A0ABD3NWN3_9STRA|eukprot:CCRYP_019083-RA/>CCRYP_019083-RA protein AED:0.30 eAED:0.30 QI:111/1/1/1/1/1/2/250/421
MFFITFPHSLRLLTAGLLSIPALILLVCIAPVVVLLSLPSLAILVRRKTRFLPSFQRTSSPKAATSSSDCTDHSLLQHAVITGGSSGIGLAIAIELAKLKCRHITLIARREEQLKDAKRLVEEAAATRNKEVSDTTNVHIVSIDVTDFNALDKKAADICCTMEEDATTSTKDDKSQSRKIGPPTLLFNCAGYSIPLAFKDLSPAEFSTQINVNYLGSVHVVKAFLPYMLGTHQNRNNDGNKLGGNIILTSSMSGQVGSYGYSAYSPTKFALRGFAESLSMELDAAGKGAYDVNISLAYPPDTNTPGYEEENKKKPEACRLISESGGIWDPQVVAKKMVKEALSPNPPFDIYFGIDGWMLSTLTAGMNPVTSVLDAICQVSLMGLLRFVSLFYLMDFGRITQNCSDGKDRRGSNGTDEFKTD